MIASRKSLLAMQRRCYTLEKERVELQQKITIYPAASLVSRELELEAQLTELRIQNDSKCLELDTIEKRLQVERANDIKELEQKVEFLQHNLSSMTSMRDEAKSELQQLANELRVLKQQCVKNEQFATSREQEMSHSLKTLRSSLDAAVKGSASIQRHHDALQKKAEAQNIELTKQNDELRDIIAKLRAEYKAGMDQRDQRIAALEKSNEEYEASFNEKTTKYSRDLEDEMKHLQNTVVSEQKSYAAFVKATKRERAKMRLVALRDKLRMRQRHANYYSVSVDFAKSLKRQLVEHGYEATKTCRSMNAEIEKLKKELEEMRSSKDSLAEVIK